MNIFFPQKTSQRRRSFFRCVGLSVFTWRAAVALTKLLAEIVDIRKPTGECRLIYRHFRGAQLPCCMVQPQLHQVLLGAFAHDLTEAPTDVLLRAISFYTKPPDLQGSVVILLQIPFQVLNQFFRSHAAHFLSWQIMTIIKKFACQINVISCQNL